jgi:glycosyltransferase involved in cell wall biosynthesis
MSEPLKILFVRTAMTYGGADRITLNILKDFNREKYTCDLALVKKHGEYLNEIPSDVKVIDLKAANSFFSFFSLRKVLRKNNYDVVYSTCGGTNAAAVIATKWLRKNLKVVVSERNVMLPPGKNKLKQFLQHTFKKLTYPQADFVTVVSKALEKEVLQKTKVLQEKIRVLYNPVINKDLLLQKDEIVTHKVFKSGIPVILAVGRFVYQKDYPTLFRAFEKVIQTTRANLFILGTGPLEEELKTMVKTMGLSENVVFAGFDKNPFKYMKNCSVFVLSSKHEGMPGVLIQAMACGAAVVSTDCPTGPSEVIEDEVNGFLVPVENHEMMSEKILELLSNKDLIIKFAEQAKYRLLPFYYKTAINSYFEFLNN